MQLLMRIVLLLYIDGYRTKTLGETVVWVSWEALNERLKSRRSLSELSFSKSFQFSNGFRRVWVSRLNVVDNIIGVPSQL